MKAILDILFGLAIFILVIVLFFAPVLILFYLYLFFGWD